MRSLSQALLLENDQLESSELAPDHGSRETPVAPEPEWAPDEAPTRANSVFAQCEAQFWDAPPRYSVMSPLSVLPPPELPAPSRARQWSAKLLFASVLFVVTALLGFEMVSVAQHQKPGASVSAQ